MIEQPTAEDIKRLERIIALVIRWHESGYPRITDDEFSEIKSFEDKILNT